MSLTGFRFSSILVGLMLYSAVAPLKSLTQELSSNKYEDTPLYQNALFIVDASVEELKGIQDINARIELTEKILPLLGKNRPEHCRKMLDSLFDSALGLKNPSPSDDKTKQIDSGTIIKRIIEVVASFDRKLAQSYIGKYTAYENLEGKSSDDQAQGSQVSAEMQLKLATALIAKNPALAISAAEPSLNVKVSSQTLIFLGTLRKRDIALANMFFAKALRSVQLRQGYDVNEFFLLYSYVFSPRKVPYFMPQGLAILQIPSYSRLNQDYGIDSETAKQYIQTLMQVVLDPSRYSTERVGRLTAGAAGDLHLINLIEPLAATYLPASFESLTQYKSLVSRYLQPDMVTKLQSQLGRWNSYGEKAATAPLPEQSDSSPYNKRNDRAYYSAALEAAKAKENEKALQLVEKISQESRQRAKDLILFTIAENAVTNFDIERAESIARHDGDLVRRAYILTLVAEALFSDKQNDRVRANGVLTELGQIAAKLDDSKQRFAILSGAAAISSRFDKFRASEFLREAIKVANKINDFDGNPKIGFSIQFEGFGFFYPLYRDDLTFYAALRRLAVEDFAGALFDVRTLDGQVARLKAIITVCEPVLSKEIIPRS